MRLKSYSYDNTGSVIVVEKGLSVYCQGWKDCYIFA